MRRMLSMGIIIALMMIVTLPAFAEDPSAQAGQTEAGESNGDLLTPNETEETDPSGEDGASQDDSDARAQDEAPRFSAGRDAAESVVFDCGSDAGTLQNIALAADSVYDFTLAPGDAFSFNEVVGPLKEDYGYVVGVSGSGSQVVGGGAAQVASALWLLVQDRSDVAIVEKSTYGSSYSQSYVDNSSDAILIDYDGGTDFVFRNIGSDYMTLYVTLQDSTLTAALYVQ